MTPGLDPPSETVWVDAETGATEKKPFLICEVAEGREGEHVILVKCRGELARVERRRHFALDALAEGLRQEEVIAPLRVERNEEPQLIFPDGAADITADVYLREAVRGGSRERQVPGPANQSLRRK